MKPSIETIKELNLKYMVANQKNLGDVTKSLELLLAIANEIEATAGKLQESGFKDASTALQSLVEQVVDLPKQLQEVQTQADRTPEVIDAVRELTDVVSGQKLDPDKPIDFQPLIKGLGEIKSAVSGNSTDTSKLEKLTSEVATAVKDVKKAISSLSFPVPNYVLPFSKDGKAAQVALESNGSVPVSATFSGTVTTSPTYKDDPTASGESPKYGKTNSSSHKQMVEADITANTIGLASESGGNLATIAAKDFATQTTLALIKAKTDNIDVALSTRTKPADTQTISGAVTTAAPTTIYNGKKTVTTAGTRVTLAASQAVKSVVIKALVANTGIIYVGDTSVASTNGFALAAGETLGLDIANLNTVNLDSSVNGEGVTFVGTN